MNKNFNKRAYEILRNYEILAFIDKKNIKKYFENLKNIYNNNDNEKAFSKYYENTWLKKI